MSHNATNWSEQEDAFTQTFFLQQQSQIWFAEEIPISNDTGVWRALSDAQRLAYTRASAGLNAMDTLQGEEGMPALKRLVPGHQRKATLGLFSTLEDIHARSYSMANKTFLSAGEERAVFEWLESQPQIQFKIRAIREVYTDPEASLWRKMAVSCLLETALFYSGFFYPLYLAGQGQMVNMGEVFNLIIKDEALHGVYVALLAQEELHRCADPAREGAWFYDLADVLYANECAYAEALYGELGLVEEVQAFIRYNFNVMCDNLGITRMFEDQTVHPVVLNGINARNTTHDFFSSKGNSYQKIAVRPLTQGEIEEAWNV